MPTATANSFGARDTLRLGAQSFEIYRFEALEKQGVGRVELLPFSLRILLENLLRQEDGGFVRADDIRMLASWKPGVAQKEIAFMPARVLLQDFTGVPAVVDLAAMREAIQRMGGDPRRINPLFPAELVIDHSVQVDSFGSVNAFGLNAELEFQRNVERYAFLRWGQRAFRNFKVVPPDTGICHQVNLEYLARVVCAVPSGRTTLAYPDSLVGTDSHTTMINGLGVFGWGVGGIEAEAAMLGQPFSMLVPQVVGFKLHGRLRAGATATDLVLTVTEMLRQKGVVGKFVEFYGTGLSSLTLPDRATIANMAPEYGATVGFFPVDDQTLNYLRLTGRDEKQIDLVERYCKEQSLWRQSGTAPLFDQVLDLDLGTVMPSLAGPRRPQDRVALPALKQTFRAALAEAFKKEPQASTVPRLDRLAAASADDQWLRLTHGDVVIAAITSCTNTSNPSVMIAAGLLAKKAVEKGLKVPPYVKTSLAPGSRVVTDYLEKGGLTPFLERLGFNTVGYGCTTCIGNSGPLPEPIANAVQSRDLVVAAVLSGNRNFEGRINPHVKASYLASPPLVVAYALAGTVDVNLIDEPIGRGHGGKDVYLRDIWPTQDEISRVVDRCVSPDMFRAQYARVYSGNDQWNKIPVKGGELFNFDPASTYIQEPPFFTHLSAQPGKIEPITSARVLVMVGDSVTTDHISPAGSIKKDSPAGKYLMEQGVGPLDFNQYGARRGNDRVMTRGTFANIRLKNLLAAGAEGGVTQYLPTGQIMPIFDASQKYQADHVPLIVLAGKDYGMGSSRDWAAKGVMLLGVKAVIAASFERIHRSNLVGMGVLPLVFKDGQTRSSLGLSGDEIFEIQIDDHLQPKQDVTVKAGDKTFVTTCRIDTPVEVEYYRNGGILQTVLRRLLKK